MDLPLSPWPAREGATAGQAGVWAATAAAGPGECRHPGWALAASPLMNRVLGVQFADAAGHFRTAMERLAGRPEDAVSLAIAVPFCAAHCLCCERPIHAAQPGEVIDDYVTDLVAEIRQLADRVGCGREVLQLHLGGGTASELGESQLARLVHALQQAFSLPADAEMSVECDPRRTGAAQLRLLRGLGFGQVTFGVLDLDADVQRAIGRRHSTALVEDVCDLARACGIGSINLDLMVGLPRQTEAGWQMTLERAIGMAPDRITLAMYRHRPWLAPVQHAIDAGALPDAESCARLAEQAAAALCAAGYGRIGDDHFVLDTDPLAAARAQGTLRRSLIAYTATPPTPLLGLGAGAVGEVEGQVFWSETALPHWRDAVRAGRPPVVLCAELAPAPPQERDNTRRWRS